jgi:hypothetical protein
MNCSYCGSKLHPTSHCPKTWGGQANRNRLRCSYCGGADHNYEACPKIRSHPAQGGITVKDKKP